MNERAPWDKRYEKGDLPWETGRHDQNLADIIEEYAIKPCKALEIGCGTGNNAIWLAHQGFDVTATDLSGNAITMAHEKTAALDIAFYAADILVDPIPGTPHNFAFDRGCFHSMDSADERTAFAQTICGALAIDGLWLSLMGSTDGPDRETGPPRLSAVDIASAVEPLFEILCLRTTEFDSEMSPAPRAWACLMRKRASHLL